MSALPLRHLQLLSGTAALLSRKNCRYLAVSLRFASSSASPTAIDMKSVERETQDILSRKGDSECEKLLSDLRTDHAGEFGAVAIYEGALPFVRSKRAKDFVHEHIETERSHLKYFESIVPPGQRTALLPLWKVAGWTLGALPSMISDRALFITVDAVESFVEEHYQEQIQPLRTSGRFPALRKLLEECCADEVHHRDDARARHTGDDESAFSRESHFESLKHSIDGALL